jgi:hypothetical protein
LASILYGSFIAFTGSHRRDRSARSGALGVHRAEGRQPHDALTDEPGGKTMPSFRAIVFRPLTSIVSLRF